jgi:hypothetical protein
MPGYELITFQDGSHGVVLFQMDFGQATIILLLLLISFLLLVVLWRTRRIQPTR